MIQPSKEITYLSPLAEAAPDPSRALLQALAQRGIASLDLTSVLRQEASKGEPLFLAANRYPNAQGRAYSSEPSSCASLRGSVQRPQYRCRKDNDHGDYNRNGHVP